jgi:hypothetical protein
VGIDVNEDCVAYEEDQIAVRIGDQKDSKFLSRVIEEFGMPDVVLDDGSHKMVDVTASFGYLYPRLSANGLYVVEDLHTAFGMNSGEVSSAKAPLSNFVRPSSMN